MREPQDQMGDRIHITGVRAYGYTGYLPEEQRLGQWFQVDLTVWRDLRTAGDSDRLKDTYDYSRSVPEIQALIQSSKCQLIESLAEAIANRVLQAADVTRVQVRLTKLTPPIPNFDGQVTIDITRP
jgi:dihydroneopterin aldolase